MSTHSHRTSRKFSNSPTLHSTPTTSTTTTDDLHRTSAPTDKRTRRHPPPLPQQQQSSPLSPQHQQQQHITYRCRTRNSPYRSPTTRTANTTRSPASSPLSTRKHNTVKMPHQPQTSHPDQPYYLYPSMQNLDPAREMELQLQQAQPWMMATMIEDDDLTFGGKPLSTWYEEDRRRYSVGDESEPSPDFEEEEEEQRGRQRDRPHYQHPKSSHGHHKKSHHHHHHHHHKSHHEEKKH